MKNENQFNAFLSKELRKMHGKQLFHLKASDRFTEGVSDFLIWYACNTFALEVKFVKEWPKETCKLLGHEFTGAQLTFLESMSLAGNVACGLVANGAERMMYLIPWDKIPKNGNWKTHEFLHHTQHFAKISWDDPQILIASLMTRRIFEKNYER